MRKTLKDTDIDGSLNADRMVQDEAEGQESITFLVGVLTDIENMLHRKIIFLRCHKPDMARV
jgi:hypothetical protein